MMMNKIIIFLVALSTLLTASCGEGFGNNYHGFHSFSNHLTAPVVRARRQTSNQDFTQCNFALVRTVCSSSYAQDHINAISKCGERARADVDSTEYSCRQNPNGIYCGEIQQFIQGNCSFNSCSTECFNTVRLAGCCAQGSYSRYALRCGISVPSPCPSSSLRIPNIIEDSTCNNTEKYRAIRFPPICDNVAAFVNGLNKVEGCQLISNFYADTCSSRNGQLCQVEFGVAGSTRDPKTTPDILAAALACPSVSNCTLQCSTSLRLVRNTVGCCIHALNATFNPQRISSLNVVYNAMLWEDCGIAVPERCGTTALSFTCINGLFASIIISILSSF